MKRLDASRISSVLGLKVTPKKVIFLFLKLFLRIFFTRSVNNNFLFSLELITLFTIDRLVENCFAVSSKALVSFGKQDPP